MIEYIGIKNAIEKINALSNEKIPFIFLINFDQSEAYVSPLKDVSKDYLKYEIGEISNTKPSDIHDIKQDTFKKTPITYEKFEKAFNNVLENIRFGNSFLTNLTFETPIETSMSLEQIFYQSKARYKIWLKDQFVCFSPEIFVKIESGQISSFPMKGTIDASLENAEEIILNDKKELAEHVTIVDLIRNDLSMVADQVHVPAFRYTELIKTNQRDLIQVSSKVSGKIRDEYKNRMGDLIAKILPAGSISGAPKPQTLNIIQQAENHERDYYTGVCGVFDGESLNCGVMIRYISEKDGKKYFKSGGGITNFSDPEKEYQEYIDKIYLPI